MRILFCNYEYPPIGGGGGVINALLAEELAKKHEVSVWTSRGFDLPEYELKNGVHVYRVEVAGRREQYAASLHSLFGYVYHGILQGKKLFKDKPIDIINTHFAVPTGPVGHSLAKMLNVPNVLTVHGGDLYDPSKTLAPNRYFFTRWLVRRILRQANVVIGQSSNTVQNVANIYCPEIQSKLIPLGIKKPHSFPRCREKYKIKKNDFVLVTVGRIIKRKQIHQLVELMQNYKEKPVKLVVVGGGPLLEKLQNQAKNLDVYDQIIFAGAVSEDEKFILLRNADLYVSTSQHEGFGIVFLEGMASALPVICYNFGGQTDFLTDNETGFLIQLDDLNTFQEKVTYCIDHPHEHKRMAKNALAKVENYFIETCAKQYEDVFHAAIENHKN